MLQGIEFWSNVCDEEVDLSIEAEEAQDMNRPPEHVSRFYAKGALQFIVPILMQTLTKQEEFDDDWNRYDLISFEYKFIFLKVNTRGVFSGGPGGPWPP